MKSLSFIFIAVVLVVALGGCQTEDEKEQQSNQRRYDAIVKQNQKMIDQNQQKMQNQQNQ